MGRAGQHAWQMASGEACKGLSCSPEGTCGLHHCLGGCHVAALPGCTGQVCRTTWRLNTLSAHADDGRSDVRGCISCGSASALVVAARGPGPVCCRQDYAELAGVLEEADVQDLPQDNLGFTDLVTEDAGGVAGCRQQCTSRRALVVGLLCFFTSAAGTVLWV